MRTNPYNYLAEIEKLRKVRCHIEGPQGPEPYEGTVMHLAHVLLTRSDLVDFDVLLRSNKPNPWTSRAVKGPTLIWRAPVYGLTTPDSFYTCTSVFSNTTKMRCPSFSLPAGPPGAKTGGSCAQAGNTTLVGGAALEPIYICRNCYSVQGQYRNPNVQLAQAVTLAWVKMLLADGGAKRFADAMIFCLEDYLLWRHAKMNLKYFRIHDSGDMGWDKGSYEYYKGWVRVAKHFENRVLFWAPTRDYHNPSFADVVRKVKRPKNLVVRPSALRFQTSAPRDIAGFDAGSTSAYDVRDLTPVRELADWDCPAYAGEKEKSCEVSAEPDGTRPCRVCWTHPHLSVNYQPHKAGLSRYALGLGRHVPQRWRENPSQGLDDDELTDLDRAEAEANIPRDRG